MRITRRQLERAARVDGSSVERLAWWLEIDECTPAKCAAALADYFEVTQDAPTLVPPEMLACDTVRPVKG